MIDDLHLRKQAGHSANDVQSDHLPVPHFAQPFGTTKQQPVAGSIEIRSGKLERLIATTIAIQAQEAEEATLGRQFKQGAVQSSSGCAKETAVFWTRKPSCLRLSKGPSSCKIPIIFIAQQLSINQSLRSDTTCAGFTGRGIDLYAANPE